MNTVTRITGRIIISPWLTGTRRSRMQRFRHYRPWSREFPGFMRWVGRGMRSNQINFFATDSHGFTRIFADQFLRTVKSVERCSLCMQEKVRVEGQLRAQCSSLKSKRVPRWCGVHSSRPVARLMTLARPAFVASLAGHNARSSLGLRAHRQPDKPTLRLGTLSCLQHFFFVRLDQRFAIDPHLPSFSTSRSRR